MTVTFYLVGFQSRIREQWSKPTSQIQLNNTHTVACACPMSQLETLWNKLAWSVEAFVGYERVRTLKLQLNLFIYLSFSLQHL